MVNQRTATVNTILSVMAENGVDYELGGEVRAKDIFDQNPSFKKQVHEILFQAFRAKEVIYRPEFQIKVNDDSELKKYISGLTNNWLRKARELNSGEAYVPANPGSRAGSGDAQVRELKKLLKKVKGTAHEDKVQAAITARIAEIKPEATITINTDLIPADLQDLVD